MGFAIVNAGGIYAGAWSRWDNPPRQLQAGESVVEVEDPDTLPQRPQAEVNAERLVQLRNAAKAALADARAESALIRAALLVIVDEFNTHSAKTNAILTAIDNATNLANLKVAIAAIADLPQRTGAQLRTAANNKLDAGNADT